MSGHNKWSQIKHKKGVVDAKKSKLFSKLARLITSESKKAKGDASAPGLRGAIEKARGENMPGDNIERAIKKGLGTDAGNMEAALYESYGPGGVAILVSVLTDNKNRTAQEIKHLLSEQGFALAEMGAARWAFKESGGTWIPETFLPLSDPDLEALSRLVDLLEEHDDVQNVYTNAE